MIAEMQRLLLRQIALIFHLNKENYIASMHTTQSTLHFDLFLKKSKMYSTSFELIHTQLVLRTDNSIVIEEYKNKGL